MPHSCGFSGQSNVGFWSILNMEEEPSPTAQVWLGVFQAAPAVKSVKECCSPEAQLEGLLGSRILCLQEE